MKIYLDFDGTVVEHAYPTIGTYNPGCIEVIKSLQETGHEIILNTMRVEFYDGSLQAALHWLSTAHSLVKNSGPGYSHPLAPFNHTSSKIHPTPWNWATHQIKQCIFIDDICEGIPLRKNKVLHGWMVDWEQVAQELKENGVL
jgi:hypothetical protein